MAYKRQNINHKLGTRVPLTSEMHYEESNISDAGTLQFLLLLTYPTLVATPGMM
jgi:hypothetical protein